MTPDRPARTAGRRYLARLAVAFGAYLVLLVAALVLFGHIGDTGWRWLVMALPIPAVLGIVASIARYVSEADERQSAVLVESLAIGFCAGSVVTFSYGLMQIAGAPPLPWLWVLPVYFGCWAVGAIIAGKRR